MLWILRLNSWRSPDITFKKISKWQRFYLIFEMIHLFHEIKNTNIPYFTQPWLILSFTGLLQLAFSISSMLSLCSNPMAQWLREYALQLVCLGSNSDSANSYLCYSTSLLFNLLTYKINILILLHHKILYRLY